MAAPQIRAPGAPSAPPPALTLVDVRAGYGGVERLHGVDLELGTGVHLLIGANGSGKTTLLRVIAGVLPLRDGTIRIGSAGSDSTGPSAAGAEGAGRNLGYVAHRPALSPRLTVAQELEFWGRVLGMSAGERAERSDQVTHQLGLERLLDRLVAELSRGQLQRVAIAKALLHDPQVLLLDEPFAGVDPQTAQHVRDRLRELGRSGRTILISSHELAESAGMGADLVVMSRGRVLAQGTTEELLPGVDSHSGEWMRLRAGNGSVDRIARRRIPYRTAGEGLEVQVANHEQAASLVRDLVGAGIEVYELSPVRNDLTQIFLHLQEHEQEHRYVGAGDRGA